MLDKKEFVEGVIARRLRLHEIVSEARAEIRQTESRAIRPVGIGDYVWFLRILVFFLISKVKAKPENLSDDEFQILLPLAQHLVDRGDLSPDTHELFI